MLSLLTPALALLSAPPASALLLEGFAGYEPQTTCSPWAKPGSLALAHWLSRHFPSGRMGGISRACDVGGTSEHKEGRAIDYMLDVNDPVQRQAAYRLLAELFAPDKKGDPAALARRMGIMYVIWNDKLYGSYRDFAPENYLASGCTSLSTCSKTLRHRDHVHISLTRAGGWGQTSWYRKRGVQAIPVEIPGTRRIDMDSTAYYGMQLPVDGTTVTTPFKLARHTTYTLYLQGLYRTGPGDQVADPVCKWDRTQLTWVPMTTGSTFGVYVNGQQVTATACDASTHAVTYRYTASRTDFMSLRFVDTKSPGNDQGAISVHLVQPQLVHEVNEPPRPVTYGEPRPATRPGPTARRLTDESLDVPARARHGKLTTRSLKGGARYVVTVRGVAFDGTTPFDAECVQWKRGWRYRQTQNLTTPEADHLNLYVDGVKLNLRPTGGDPGQCSTTNHVYRGRFVAPVDGRARLKVWDPNDYTDNSGALSVRIRKLAG